MCFIARQRREELNTLGNPSSHSAALGHTVHPDACFSVFQRNSRWTRFLSVVLLLSVLAAMTIAATHVHADNKVDHAHCSLCQMASEMVAVCAVVLAIFLLSEISYAIRRERAIELTLWQPSVPRVRPPPTFLFA